MMIIDIDLPNGCGTWPLDTGACDDLSSLPASGFAAEIAVANLYHLTGSRLGLCTTTFRPCLPGATFTSTYRSGFAQPPSLTSPSTWLAPGTTLTSPAYACSDCFTTGTKALTLPVYPVQDVVQLTIQDEVYAGPTGFAVYDHREIVWQHPDGLGFPGYQDLSLPLGADRTWGITVTHGNPLPSSAAYILGLYTCELAKQMSNLKCALPSTVQSVNRQGISYQLVNEDYLQRGLIGHPLIDQWILTQNPYRTQGRPSVHSPESIKSRPRIETSGALTPPTLPVGDYDTPGQEADEVFTYVQSTPATVWTANHNWGTEPTSVLVLDTAGNRLVAQVHVTTSTVTVTHAIALSGRVILGLD